MFKKNWLWMLLTVILGSFHIVTFRQSPGEAIIKSAQLGVVFLVLVLLPKNIIMWLPQDFAGIPLLKKLVVWRRDLGIVSGILFAMHAMTATMQYGNFQPSYLLQKVILPGAIALLIVYLLLLTSSSWSLRTLKQTWGKIQSLIWIAVPLALLHSIIATLGYRGEYSVFGIVGLGGSIIFVCVEAYLFFRNPEKAINNRWKHIRLVSVGSILALLLFFFYP